MSECEYVALEYAEHVPTMLCDADGTMIIGIQETENIGDHTVVSIHIVGSENMQWVNSLTALLPAIGLMFPELPNGDVPPILPPVALLKLSYRFPPATTSMNTQAIVTIKPDRMRVDRNHGCDAGSLLGLDMTVRNFMTQLVQGIAPFRGQLDSALVPIFDQVNGLLESEKRE